MAKKTNGKRHARTRKNRGKEPAEGIASTEPTKKLTLPPEPKPRRNRAKTAAAASQTKSTPPPKSQPRRKRKKRVSIGESLRGFGLDEHKFAEAFAAAGSGLIKAAGDSGEVTKSFLDYLKEWSRYLEPPRTVEREVNDRAVPFMLVHHMPRPVREPAGENKNASAQPPE